MSPILERLVLHDMAPVAGRIADRQKDRLVLAAARGRTLRSPHGYQSTGLRACCRRYGLRSLRQAVHFARLGSRGRWVRVMRVARKPTISTSAEPAATAVGDRCWRCGADGALRCRAYDRIRRMELAVETHGLTRDFGSHSAPSMASISAVQAGSFYGFLGPNGAGKSTTIKCLTGLLRPTSGTMRILGIDPLADPVAVKRRIGVVPEDLALFDRSDRRRNADLRRAGPRHGCGHRDAPRLGPARRHGPQVRRPARW